MKNIITTILVLVAYVLVVGGTAILVDGRHPAIVPEGEETITVEYGSEFTDPGARACYTGRLFGESKKRAPEMKVSGAVDTSVPGDYTIEYATVSGNKSDVFVRHVSVVDSVPPVITLLTDEDYLPIREDGYQEEGWIATDNCDGDISDRVKVEYLTNSAVYTVSDSSGNETRLVRSIDWAEPQPRILLNGEKQLTLTADYTYTDPGFTATDGYGEDISVLVVVENHVKPYSAGTYTVDYTVEYAGWTVSEQRTVEVVPVEKAETYKPNEKVIYLTFDDGPSPYTENLLYLLKVYGAKATFFVTGNNPDYNYLIGKAYSQGHAIGVHTWCHDYDTIYKNEDAYFEDFLKIQELIKEQTGSYSKIFRFPGGSSNGISRSYNDEPGIMTRLAQDATDLGLQYFDWNVDSDDAGSAVKAEQVAKNIKEECAMYGPVCVVLQHDIKSWSVNAVESVLVWGKKNGYEFRALDETCWGAHHDIFN